MLKALFPVVFLISILSAAVAVRAEAPRAHFPDIGLRNRLAGCWNVESPASSICFDGVDRVRFKSLPSPIQVRTGTFTVADGHLLLDLTPESNLRGETYNACRLMPPKSLDRDVKQLFLSGCTNFEKLPPALRLGRGEIVLDRAATSWIDSTHYEGGGNSSLPGPLRGCWDRRDTREHKQWLAEVQKTGPYLSAFSICFDGETRGKTTSTTFDADDGWDDGGTFRMIDGWLELDGKQRCQAIGSESDLALVRCAYWSKLGGVLRPTVATDPLYLTRSNE